MTDKYNHIKILSDLRGRYNCFEEGEEPYYEALSAGIAAIKALEQDERTCEGCLYEMNSGFEEECYYCNRCGSDRYVNKEEYDEDEDDE